MIDQKIKDALNRSRRTVKYKGGNMDAIPFYDYHIKKKHGFVNTVTEEEKEAWIKNNTFFCKRVNGKISDYACKVFQRDSLKAVYAEFILGRKNKDCSGCKKFMGKKKK